MATSLLQQVTPTFYSGCNALNERYRLCYPRGSGIQCLQYVGSGHMACLASTASTTHVHASLFMLVLWRDSSSWTCITYRAVGGAERSHAFRRLQVRFHRATLGAEAIPMHIGHANTMRRRDSCSPYPANLSPPQREARITLLSRYAAKEGAAGPVDRIMRTARYLPTRYSPRGAVWIETLRRHAILLRTKPDVWQ